MTLLVFLAIPSFVALCFLAIAHTLQTMNLRLAESAPFPTDFSPEFVAAAAALGATQAAVTRVYSFDRLLNASAWRSRRYVISKESDLPRFLRMPASFLPEYRRNRPDFSSRIIGDLDGKNRASAGRANFPRRRTRLAAPTRRARYTSLAFAS